LARRVILLAEAFNRTLSDDLVAFWVEELAPHYGENLFEAMRASMCEKWMPSINELLERERKVGLPARIARAELEYARQRDQWARALPEHTANTEQRDREAKEFFRAMREKLGLADDEPSEPH